MEETSTTISHSMASSPRMRCVCVWIHGYKCDIVSLVMVMSYLMQVRFYSSELILALEHIHSQNIVYRDLKVPSGDLCTIMHLHTYMAHPQINEVVCLSTADALLLYSPPIFYLTRRGTSDCLISVWPVTSETISLPLVCKYEWWSQ